MNTDKIGKVIKNIRIKNNLTQSEFADRYGVTYQAVSKWENGKNIPDISLLKQICKDFNINIDDLLEGKLSINKKNNHKYMYVFISCIVILLLVLIYMLLNNKDNFYFKTLSSSCNNFTITGSIAYNNKKSSIYISNIDYCGGEDNNDYKDIECILYENSNNIDTKISTYNYNDKSSTIKLEDFLKDIYFHIDNYDRTCKIYSENSLYLMINATNSDNEVTTYKINLSLDDSCKK